MILTQKVIRAGEGTRPENGVGDPAHKRGAANPENGTATYTYNVEGLVATKTDARNQQVQYSSLSRLISAATTGPEWGQSFVYDGFGNLTDQVVTKGSAPSLSMLVNPANNRITTGGYSYDANGNLAAMPLLTLSYDVDNRLAQATHSSNGTD